ncbi:protein of unknown function [Xenorhabdus bovienii]|uniref:Uncharacterized protein n=1 Tax=Xenorhabdus bovienii TaxID=40576 RepID=A0A0B6X7F2_XENBV|nr:protein of unknown function [Xenorhabdus bovienii]
MRSFFAYLSRYLPFLRNSVPRGYCVSVHVKRYWDERQSLQLSDIVEIPCDAGLEADIVALESTVDTVWFVYAYQAMVSGVRSVKFITVDSLLLISRLLHLIC